MSLVKFGALVVGACALLSASAATYYVDAVNGDDGNDGTSATNAGGGVGPKKTFEAGVSALSANNDVLTIAPGHYVLSAVSTDKFSGTRYIGTGEKPDDVLVDGGGKVRALLASTAGGHRFVNLCFTNCVATGAAEFGAAIQLNGSDSDGPATSYFTNVVFACNRGVNGGAVGSCGVVMSGCRFEGNVAASAGGALYFLGKSHSYYLYDCQMVSNRVESGWGGAISSKGQYSYGYHYGCTYSGNSASSGGCFDQNSIAMVSNCTFVANSTTGDGGVYISGNTTSMFRSFKDCRFYGNQSGGNGACIRNTKDGLIFERCAFADNVAGGCSVIFTDSCLIYRVSQCGFTNNVSKSSGSVLANGCGLIEGTSFVSNRTEVASVNAGRAGACQFDSSYADTIKISNVSYNIPHLITNCLFLANSATITNRAMHQAYVRGGALSFGTGDTSGSKNYSIVDCRFIGNFIDSDRGYNGIDCGGAIWAPLGVSIDRCVFAGNRSTMAGGAFAGYSTNVTRCVFVGNIAESETLSEAKTGCGGALAFLTEPWSATTNGVYQVVSDCAFVSNRVTGLDGSAVLLAQGHMKLIGCVFTNNVAGLAANWYMNHGGAVAFDAARCSWWSQKKSSWRYYGYNLPELAQQKFEIDRCTFDANESMGHGGAVNIYESYVSNSVPSPVGLIKNSLFCGNVATNYPGTTADWLGRGGALCVNNQPIGIENCTFIGNRAVGGGKNSLGGAIYSAAANIGITNCIFYANADDNTGTTSSDTVKLPNTAAYDVIDYSYGPTVSQFNTGAGHHNILSDANPFRGDDHCDLAVRGGCGQGAGLVLDWMTADATDLGGKPRLADGCVDFGCYQLWFKPGFLLFVR